jgi:hypothetical protein
MAGRARWHQLRSADPESSTRERMNDDGQFSSGPWTGFYQYPGDTHRHRQDLQLTFGDGTLRGTGSDDVGRFAIHGRYDGSTREVRWVKSYFGRHDVHYRGFREGKGIWGTWEIAVVMRGGFHIWPRGEGAGEQEAEVEEAPLAEGQPVPAVVPDASALECSTRRGGSHAIAFAGTEPVDSAGARDPVRGFPSRLRRSLRQ